MFTFTSVFFFLPIQGVTSTLLSVCCVHVVYVSVCGYCGVGVVLCACGADECNKRCSDEESSEAISRTCVLIVLHSPCEVH